MNSTQDQSHWWCSAHFRVTHSTKDLSELSSRLSVPQTESNSNMEASCGVKNGVFFWCPELKVQSPDRPDSLVAWAERLAKANETILSEIMGLGGEVYVYIGIHTSVLALGFDLPPTPTLSKMGIAIGLEYFAS